MPNIFQTEEWAKFKTETGYQKYYDVDGVFVLQKLLPLGRTMLYSPMIDQSQISNLKPQNYISKLKTLAKENKAIFYRAEFDSPIIPDTEYLIRSGFTKAFEEMQPEHTLILNISKNEEDILAGMKQKGRYNIKIAEKHNIKVRKSRQVDNFYRLYEETAKRQKITYRNKQYFRALLDNLEPKGYCELFEAYVEDTRYKIQDTNINQSTNHVLASAIIAFYKGRVTYLFGSSSSEMRNLMAPYKLHWQIIQEAKRRGFIEYDFFGIAPDDNPNHPWAGVTRFKKQFGGNEIKLLGSWDLILRPTEYKIFKIAEKIRRRK